MIYRNPPLSAPPVQALIQHQHRIKETKTPAAIPAVTGAAAVQAAAAAAQAVRLQQNTPLNLMPTAEDLTAATAIP